MIALTDSHTFLWYVWSDPRLSKTALAEMNRGENILFLSVASAWEIAIKCSLNKLKLSEEVSSFVTKHTSVNRIQLLEINLAHIAQIAKLPFHHRDPFDRMLVAQCLVEKIPIISVDSNLDKYGIQRIW